MAAVTAFTSANFDAEVLQSPVPVLVDFYADWCSPCKMLAPIVEDLAKDLSGRVKVGKLDVDAAGDVAGRFGIRAIPTLILFSAGRPKTQIQGLTTKGNLLKTIEAALK
jgi:thioredoxin 1